MARATGKVEANLVARATGKDDKFVARATGKDFGKFVAMATGKDEDKKAEEKNFSKSPEFPELKGVAEVIKDEVDKAEVKEGLGQQALGWCGKGSPIRVQNKGKLRGLHDGAGLCSPGRWLPGKRLLPVARLEGIRNLVD